MTEETIDVPPFNDGAPPNRYCDVVLTGGITSAIAYPPVILGLAATYRFHSVGGTSSGAGSAALAAAAEYRRRHGSADGFRVLQERTLAVADVVQGQTGLAWLFQPVPAHRRLFSALVPAVTGSSAGAGGALRATTTAYLPFLATGALLGLAWVGAMSAACCAQGTLAYLTWAGLGALALALWVLMADVLRLADTDFGLCDGLNAQPGAPRPPLTRWLHELLQEVAGRAPDDPPLTFADLHAAPGSPRSTLGDPGPTAGRGIELQVFTANVTHGRPYLLPQTGDEATLYFRTDEMAALFPDSVVKHLEAHSQPYQGPARLPDDRRAMDCQPPLRSLPKAQLPLIVAARMSISFPILFRGVPLWSLDQRGPIPVLRRCLFADGGLCANFPIHLFDAPVPAWPTFGVALRELDADQAASLQPATDLMNKQQLAACVLLPAASRDGRHDERWNQFIERRKPFSRLVGLAGAIFSTVKDWNDTALAQMPGMRERVVQVRLPPGIGGLNILMNRVQILNLVLLGRQAVTTLLERYTVPSPGSGGLASGWNEHRWLRFMNLRASLSSYVSGIGWAAQSPKFARPMSEHFRQAADHAPGADVADVPVQPSEAADLAGVLAVLRQFEQGLGAKPMPATHMPLPTPTVRVRPPL